MCKTYRKTPQIAYEQCKMAKTKGYDLNDTTQTTNQKAKSRKMRAKRNDKNTTNSA
jgi:hypothetical protein